ncbi:MAG: acyltransferase [Acidimicrobiales bacterium]
MTPFAPPAPARTVAGLAAATPPTRDRYVDLLRVASLGTVVTGHVLMAAVAYRHGHLVASNVLRQARPARYLTWVLQVMPVFFVVGGFSNAASWTAAERDGAGYGGWLAARVRRLVRPAAAFAMVWVGLAAAARLAGVAGPSLHTADHMVALPLWFLAVYLGVVAATPALLAAHRRWGVAAPVAMAGAVAAVDVARWTLHIPLVGWANVALVWLFAAQLGVLWRHGRLPAGTGRRLLLAGAGAGLLLALTGTAGYPVSLVGGVGEVRSNTDPPSLALVAAALLQTGLALALRPVADRWLARPRAWAAVVAANASAMTVYLWHLTALVAVAAVALQVPGMPQPPMASGAWWLLRPLWLAAVAVALVPLWFSFSPLERGRRRPAPAGAGPPATRAVLGCLVAAAGMAVLAVRGFSPSTAAGGPVVGLALVAGGWALVSAGRRLAGRAGAGDRTPGALRQQSPEPVVHRGPGSRPDARHPGRPLVGTRPVPGAGDRSPSDAGPGCSPAGRHATGPGRE